MNQKQTYLSLLFCLTCLFGSLMNNMQAQEIGQLELVSKEQLLINLMGQDLDSSLLDFLVTENLLTDIDLQEIVPFREWHDLLPTLDQKNKLQAVFEKTQLAAQLFYANTGDEDSLAVLYPRFYNRLSLQTAINLGKLPLQLQGNIVVTDFEFQQKMSGFSFSFDHREFLNRYRQKLAVDLHTIFPTSTPKLLPSSLDRKRPNSSIENAGNNAFKATELSVIQNEIKFLLYQKIIADSRFVKLISTKIPSLPNPADSLTIGDASHERILQKEKEAQEVLALYQKSWEKRKTYYGDSLNTIRHSISEQANRTRQYRDPERLQKALLKDKEKGWAERLLIASTKINIGQSVLSDSWYTAKNLPINGLHYAFDGQKWSGELAIGRQVYNTHFSPLWSSKLFNRLKGGKVLFAKGAYAFNENSEIAYAFIRIKNEGHFSRSVVLAPQNNAVFSISGKSQILPNINIHTELSFSRSVWGNPDLSINNQLNARNIASETTISANFLKNKLEIGTGHFYVGSDFFSAANPFVQNNRQGMVTKIKGRPSKQFELEAELKIGRSIDQNVQLGGDQQDVRLMGAINWKVLKNWTISGQLAPNYFRQHGVGELAVSNANMLYNLFVNTQHKLKQHLLLQSVGVTNYHSELNYVDTTWLNQSTQVYWQSSLLLANQHSLSLMSMLGWDKGAEEGTNGSSFFSELTYGLNKDRWKSSLGIQGLKDPFLANWYYGFTNSWEFQLGPKVSAALESSLQFPFASDRQKDRKRLWGRLELIKQF